MEKVAESSSGIAGQNDIHADQNDIHVDVALNLTHLSANQISVFSITQHSRKLFVYLSICTFYRYSDECHARFHVHGFH